jgi:hypothetical protein
MHNTQFIEQLTLAKDLLELCYKGGPQITYDEFVSLYDENKNNIDFGLSDGVRDSNMTKITYFNFFLIGNIMKHYGLMGNGMFQAANRKQSHLRIVK